MSTENLIKALAKGIDRRSFLTKLGIGSIGGLMTLMGLPKHAAALVNYKCCHLCNAPSSCSNCACTWCWSCQYTDGFFYQCCECHNNTSNCGSGCGSNTPCSYVIRGMLAPAG